MKHKDIHLKIYSMNINTIKNILFCFHCVFFPLPINSCIDGIVKLLLKTYAAKFYAHYSGVRKQVKLSGTCLLTIYGVGSTQLSETLILY